MPSNAKHLTVKNNIIIVMLLKYSVSSTRYITHPRRYSSSTLTTFINTPTIPSARPFSSHRHNIYNNKMIRIVTPCSLDDTISPDPTTISSDEESLVTTTSDVADQSSSWTMTTPFNDPASTMIQDIATYDHPKSLAWTLGLSPRMSPPLCSMEYNVGQSTNDKNGGRRRRQQPLVIGHRGSLYNELENTLRGFELSAAMGCDGVELDVFLLKCGTLVVFHGGGTDENPGCLSDYCNLPGQSILDYTATDARRKLTFNPSFQEFACPRDRITCPTHAVIPTLEDVLTTFQTSYPNVIVKIELKGPGTVEPVLELVERLDMVDRCHYSSFDLEKIGRIRELRRDDADKGRYRTGALFGGDVPDDFVERARSVGADEVHLKYDTCTVERIAAIRDAGMESMAWFRGPIGMMEDATMLYHDVGNEDEAMYRMVMDTGVTSMCVNKPDLLIGMLDMERSEGVTTMAMDGLMGVEQQPRTVYNVA